MEELEQALKIKQKMNELNNLPQVHSKLSNYELYLELGTNPNHQCSDKNKDCGYWAKIGECNKNPDYMLTSCEVSCGSCHTKAFGIIKSGQYWPNKAFELKLSKLDYNSVMEKNITEREEKFYSIQNSYNIKDNIEKNNIKENEDEYEDEDKDEDEDEDEAMNNEMNDRGGVRCPDKLSGEYCDGKADCWRTNFCECPKAQKLCKKNMAKKFMKDYNINKNEEVDRILNIFHGNSRLLHELPIKKNEETNEDTIETNNFEIDAKINTIVDGTKTVEDKNNSNDYEAVQEVAARQDALAFTSMEAATDATAQAQADAAQVQAPVKYDSLPNDQTVGGMNELDIDDNMEILNKFHGGSANYEKF